LRILLTNDDGLLADGLATAYRSLKSAGHAVLACAPDRERSAQSQSVTLREAVEVRPLAMPDGSVGYAVSGTPADCARLGFALLCQEKPDLVISGINNDSNLGYDVNYSGTVAAALEAAGAGYPALACSLEGTPPYRWEEAGQILLSAVQAWPSWNIPPGVAVSLNIPADIRQPGWVWARTHHEPSNDYYLLEGERDGLSRYRRLRPEKLAGDEGTDLDYFSQGRITLSPLVPVGWDRATLERLARGPLGL
jgi:5'-nucleotidase